VIVSGSSSSDAIVDAVQPGDEILLADGAVHAKVVERLSLEEVLLEVSEGGFLKDRQGIMVRNRPLKLPALSEKDMLDARFAIDMDVDFIGLSFVQAAEDVMQLRRFIMDCKEMRPFQRNPLVIAKIETKAAVDNIEPILKQSDGIMVARGDLGLEYNLCEVPRLQKMLLRSAVDMFKIAITATQMMRSMVDEPHPTRAEVSDVYNAVTDGSDALMLSEETSTGKYPVEAVKFMAETAATATDAPAASQVPDDRDGSFAIAQAAVAASRIQKDCRAIVALCFSTALARYVAKLRPDCDVIAVTHTPELATQLRVIGNVTSMTPSFEHPTQARDFLRALDEDLQRQNLLAQGDPYVFCCAQDSLPGLAFTVKLMLTGSKQQAHDSFRKLKEAEENNSRVFEDGTSAFRSPPKIIVLNHDASLSERVKSISGRLQGLYPLGTSYRLWNGLHLVESLGKRSIQGLSIHNLRLLHRIEFVITFCLPDANSVDVDAAEQYLSSLKSDVRVDAPKFRCVRFFLGSEPNLDSDFTNLVNALASTSQSADPAI
jgi:pyruvate kinase